MKAKKSKFKTYVFIAFLAVSFSLSAHTQDKSLLPQNPVSMFSIMPKDQQIIPINPGESILVAFFETNFFSPENWAIADGSRHGLFMQKDYRMFHGAMFQWLKKPTNGIGISMEKDFSTDISDYDNLIVAAVLPDKAKLKVEATTELGKINQTFDKLPDNFREYLIPLGEANQLLHLKMEVVINQNGSQAGSFMWVGLQNKERLNRYLSNLAPYGKKWKYHLKPESFEPSFQPQFGLVISKDDLNQLRTKHQAFVKKNGTSPFLEKANEYLSTDPEDLIGVSLGRNIRFARDRDLNKKEIRGSDLAIAGILTQNKEMLRMAARYALSLAITPNWDESFFAHMPGSSWVHAAFRESDAANELGIILDLAGEMFTDAGIDFIEKRLAESALGHINYITWNYEYIHRMNQLAAFSSGRMLAYAILEQSMPRVKPYLDIAYRELRQSLEKIILEDGGYVEGPGYMTFMMQGAGKAMYYYATARGKSLQEILPPNILNTGDFGEVFYSTVPENDAIPVCDAGVHVHMDAVAFLASISPDSRWTEIYNRSIHRSGGLPDSFFAFVLSNQISKEVPVIKSFVSLSEMGAMASTRKLENELLKIFVQGNKAGAGHTHEDKGSFVIEFAGDVFACDVGRIPYGDAMTFLAKQCQFHSMLVPIIENERAHPQNPIMEDVKPKGMGDQQVFHASIDVTPGWESYYKKWIRSWDSPQPNQLTISDDYELKNGDGVNFFWFTDLPVTRQGNSVVITGKKGVATMLIPDGCTYRIDELFWYDGSIKQRIVFEKHAQSGRIETAVTFKLKD